MAHPAVALLESALRARKLDQTLTTARLPGKGDENVAPTTMAGLDAGLEGGLPRGQLSEVVGARSSGRTTLLLQMLAAATRRGEIAALVDTFDQLDRVVDQVRVEVLDLLLRELHFLQTGDDLVVGEEALLLTVLDELLELLDLGKGDIDGEHGPRFPRG